MCLIGVWDCCTVYIYIYFWLCMWHRFSYTFEVNKCHEVCYFYFIFTCKIIHPIVIPETKPPGTFDFDFGIIPEMNRSCDPATYPCTWATFPAPENGWAGRWCFFGGGWPMTYSQGLLLASGKVIFNKILVSCAPTLKTNCWWEDEKRTWCVVTLSLSLLLIVIVIIVMKFRCGIITMNSRTVAKPSNVQNLNYVNHRSTCQEWIMIYVGI